MYLDSAVDGMLKGLGEEVFCMKVNVLDSALCLALVFPLVSTLGIDGYILLTVISEVVNAALSIMKLIRRTGLRPDLLRWVVFPAASVAGASSVSSLLSSLMPSLPAPVPIALTAVLYAALCFALGCVDRGDVRWAASLMKIKKRRAPLSASDSD